MSTIKDAGHRKRVQRDLREFIRDYVTEHEAMV
jgi:hypothetical protein